MRLIDMALIVGAIAVFVVVNTRHGPAHDEWRLGRSDEAGHLRLSLDHRDGHRRWSTSSDVPRERFGGLPQNALADGGKLKFTYRTDAGTLHCEGDASFGRARGGFRFEPNASFTSELEKLGYTGVPAGQELFEAMMNGVTLELARSVAGGGLALSYRELRDMAVHGVDGKYIAGIRAHGYADLRPADFVQARIHGVDAGFLGDLKKAGYDLPMKSMVDLKIHGISRDYMQEIAQAGLRPDARELVELRNHGVSPDFIREVRAAGYQFTTRELVDLRVHGVDGRYLDKLAASGFERLSAKEIVKLRTHGID